MPRSSWSVALAAALVVQLVGVYVPSAPPVPDTPVIGIDKVVHLLLFAVPAALAARALRRPALLWLALLVHAPVSELVQQVALPHRSGDPYDAVADVLGLALGVAAGTVLRRRFRGGARPLVD